MNWQNYPKTELHLHLEGAAPPEFIRKKAAQKGIDISLAISGENYQWADFKGFLATYEEVMRVLSSPEDFYDLTKAVLAEQARNGVVYTEIFLGAALMCALDATLWREIMAAIEKASEEAEPKIHARFLAVAIRHFGAENAKETARLVAQNPSPRLTGFGMAGAEDYLNINEFAPAFQWAQEAGFGLTCHSGEWGAPETIEATINALAISRLGHGVRAIESPKLMNKIKEKDIHLEICPGSNIALGAYPDWSQHPISQLRDNKISLSISSDDPPYFWTNMTNEYQKLSEIGWSEVDFKTSNLEAMRHAFCDDHLREKMIQNWN